MADSFDVQYALQDAKGRVLPAQRDALSSETGVRVGGVRVRESYNPRLHSILRVVKAKDLLEEMKDTGITGF